MSQTCQQRKSSALFNHLVCPQQECLRDCYAECFCRCKIDDQFESGRLFDRKVSGLRPLQDFIDEVGCAPEQVSILGSVRHKATRSKKFTVRVGRGQSRAQCQCIDTRDIRVYQRIRAHINGLHPVLEFLEGRRNVLSAPDFEHSISMPR